MTRQLISTNRQLLLHHVTRSVRRAAGFVQVPFGEAGVVRFRQRAFISSIAVSGEFGSWEVYASSSRLVTDKSFAYRVAIMLGRMKRCAAKRELNLRRS